MDSKRIMAAAVGMGPLIKELTRVGDVESLGEAALKGLAGLVPFEGAAFLLAEGEDSGPRLVASIGVEAGEHAGAEGTGWRAAAMEVCRRGERSAGVGDGEGAGRGEGADSPTHEAPAGAKAVLFVPISCGDRCSGAVGLWGSKAERITDSQQAGLELVGDLSALALAALPGRQGDAVCRQAEYGQLVDSVPGVVYSVVLDQQANVVQALIGPQVQELTGYRPDELVGNPAVWHRLLDGGFLPEALAELRAGRTIEKERRIIRKDRTERWIFCRASGFLDESTGLLRVIGFSYDVTALKQTQAALEAALDDSRRLYEAGREIAVAEGAEQVVNALCGLLLETRVEGFVVGLNRPTAGPGGARLLEVVASWRQGDEAPSRPSDEALSYTKHSCLTLLDSEVPLVIEPATEQDERGGKLASLLFDVPVSRMIVFPQIAGGSRVGAVVVSSEGARIESAEYNFLRSVSAHAGMAVNSAQVVEQARAANKAKSAFLARLSHEVRTPVANIIGMAELAAGTDPTSEQMELISTIRSSAESLLALNSDMMDLARIETGRIALRPREFRVKEVMDSVVRVISIKPAAQGLEVDSRVGEEVPPTVVGDPERLRQILQNLSDNAVKFTDHGRVTMGVELKERAGRELVLHFQVRDTGRGIAPELRDKVFDAFNQGDLAASKGHGGTGLGLAIVKQLVHRMGGEVWLESTVGNGSAFHFTLVMEAAAEVVAAPEEAQTAGDLGDLPALIVDSDVSSRRELVRKLTEWGVAPFEVPSSMAALTEVSEAARRERPYRLVLLGGRGSATDIQDLAVRVHERVGAGDTAIVAVGAAAQDGGDEQWRRSGVAARVKAPPSDDSLLAAIKDALGQDQVEPSPRYGAPEVGPSVPAPRPQLQVLVVEDDPGSRKLAAAVLEARGHTVTLVENGAAAIEALEEAGFDVVLLDLELPDMGGLEVFARLREQGSGGGAGRRVPVVALTAHAVQGYEARCLEAGMEGFLLKPVAAEVLARTVESVAEPGLEAVDTTIGGAASGRLPDRGEVLDLDSLRGSVGDDRELQEDLIRIFLKGCSGRVRSLRLSLEAGDLEGTRRIAHGLRGSTSNLGGGASSDAAQEVERVTEAGDEGQVVEAVERLETELQRFCRALESLLS